MWTKRRSPVLSFCLAHFLFVQIDLVMLLPRLPPQSRNNFDPPSPQLRWGATGPRWTGLKTCHSTANGHDATTVNDTGCRFRTDAFKDIICDIFTLKWRDLCYTFYWVVCWHYLKCFWQYSNLEKSVILFKVTAFNLFACCYNFQEKFRGRGRISANMTQRNVNKNKTLPQASAMVVYQWRHDPKLLDFIIKLSLLFSLLWLSKKLLFVLLKPLNML